jgi:HEAT repeat protein
MHTETIARVRCPQTFLNRRPRMSKWWMDRPCPVIVGVAAVVSLVVLVTGVPAIAQEAAETPTTEPAGGNGEEPTLESLFANYLHFALIGRFDVAEQKFGRPLVSRPEFHPMTDEAAETLIKLSEKYENSMDTLLLLVNNSTIGDTAKELLALIREANRRKRMDPSRIEANIRLLNGDPMQRTVGLERLMESGEYAVPWMLGVLTDPKQEKLQPFVVRALPKLGKKALNPLLAALAVDNEPVLQAVVETLGKIGYPQALPYLQRLATSSKEAEAVRQTAVHAIERIMAANPGLKLAPAAEMFDDLAEEYFDEIDSLRPDPREAHANLWRLRTQARPGEDVVSPIEVPREIYTLILCMDCCQASVELEPKQPAALALWLAANFRREARLGLDVESDETVDARKLDPSRPENFPRSIYFARMAGPTCCQIVLGRAVKERDRNIALGAVAALDVTAGRQAMTTGQDLNGASLGEALYFPDLLVRVQAALALGQALPAWVFHGSTEVVPVLASVLAPSNKRYYLLVDPQKESAGVIQTGLINKGDVVIWADRLGTALTQAHRELTHLDGMFLASDMRGPTVVEAIRELAKDDRFSLAPVVVLVKENDTLVLDRVAEVDNRVGSVFVLTSPNGAVDPKIVDQMLAKLAQVAVRYGQRELSAEMKLALALKAARVLQGIAASQSQIFDVRPALPTMVETLRTHPSEELRIAVATALSWVAGPQAQQVIAATALNAKETDSLRIACFGLLADSARRFGSQLDDNLLGRLKEQAVSEPNLTLRTAASQAFGATNPPVELVVPIIIPSK